MVRRPDNNSWKKKRRKDYLEPREYCYYIFCEGQKTEPNYFQGFKDEIEENPIYKDLVLIEIQPCQAETLRVLDKAEEYIRKNKIQKAQVWCVYDKDDFPSCDFNAVTQRVEKLNKENSGIEYHTAWSNECIELWFVLHFADYKSNNHRTEYVKFLDQKFMELGLGKYEKNRGDIYTILKKYGNQENAIKYAKRMIKEKEGMTPANIAPGTTVFELVEELNKYLPKK